jgi:hypothetical protein
MGSAPTSTKVRAELKEQGSADARFARFILRSNPRLGKASRNTWHPKRKIRKKTSNSKRVARLRRHHVTAFAFHAMHGWRRHVAYEIKTSTVRAMIRRRQRIHIDLSF